jgi:hypothetical protein
MSNPADSHTPKPELFLLDPRHVTAEALDQLYERLTGRKVTAEEHARSVALVEEWNARRVAQERGDDRA